MVVLTRNSVKTVSLFGFFFVFFFFSRKIVSKARVTCHNHGHTSLSSARTFVEQNWPWTTQSGAQEYRNQFFNSTPSEQGGMSSSRTRLWRRDLSLAELTGQSKNQLQLFSRELGSSGCPKVDADGRVPSWFVCRNFRKKEGVWGTEWTRVKMTRTGHSLSLCPGGGWAAEIA